MRRPSTDGHRLTSSLPTRKNVRSTYYREPVQYLAWAIALDSLEDEGKSTDTGNTNSSGNIGEIGSLLPTWKKARVMIPLCSYRNNMSVILYQLSLHGKTFSPSFGDSIWFIGSRLRGEVGSNYLFSYNETHKVWNHPREMYRPVWVWNFLPKAISVSGHDDFHFYEVHAIVSWWSLQSRGMK